MEIQITDVPQKPRMLVRNKSEVFHTEGAMITQGKKFWYTFKDIKPYKDTKDNVVGLTKRTPQR